MLVAALNIVGSMSLYRAFAIGKNGAGYGHCAELPP
jgi:hypothetical protein